jgi:tripartite-type tricarboxylate transporter receptor subunit TctC
MRKAILAASIAAFSMISCALHAQEARYPNRPVKLVVASAPGGGTDAVGRMLAQHFSQTMGQQFYVENRPGAGNMRGTDVAAKSAPDGYTLLVSASTLAINHVMHKNMPYDVVRDLAPITMLVSLPSLLVVGPDQPFRTMPEFLAAARARPGDLTYGSAGLGTQPHLAIEMLKNEAKIDMLHVPYAGVGPALIDIMGGRVTGMLVNFLSAKSQVDGGALRAIGISSLKRSRFLPDVPTIAESGVPGYEAMQWFGLLAPAGTPEPIIRRLYEEAKKGLESPEMRKRLDAEGAEPVASSPEEFRVALQAEMAKWSAVAKAARIVPN